MLQPNKTDKPCVTNVSTEFYKAMNVLTVGRIIHDLINNYRPEPKRLPERAGRVAMWKTILSHYSNLQRRHLVLD